MFSGYITRPQLLRRVFAMWIFAILLLLSIAFDMPLKRPIMVGFKGSFHHIHNPGHVWTFYTRYYSLSSLAIHPMVSISIAWNINTGSSIMKNIKWSNCNWITWRFTVREFQRHAAAFQITFSLMDEPLALCFKIIIHLWSALRWRLKTYTTLRYRDKLSHGSIQVNATRFKLPRPIFNRLGTIMTLGQLWELQALTISVVNNLILYEHVPEMFMS